MTTGRLRRHLVAQRAEEEAEVQVVQVVSGEHLPGTFHTRRRSGIRRGKKKKKTPYVTDGTV